MSNAKRKVNFNSHESASILNRDQLRIVTVRQLVSNILCIKRNCQFDQRSKVQLHIDLQVKFSSKYYCLVLRKQNLIILVQRTQFSWFISILWLLTREFFVRLLPKCTSSFVHWLRESGACDNVKTRVFQKPQFLQTPTLIVCFYHAGILNAASFLQRTLTLNKSYMYRSGGNQRGYQGIPPKSPNIKSAKGATGQTTEHHFFASFPEVISQLA